MLSKMKVFLDEKTKFKQNLYVSTHPDKLRYSYLDDKQLLIRKLNDNSFEIYYVETVDDGDYPLINVSSFDEFEGWFMEHLREFLK